MCTKSEQAVSMASTAYASSLIKELALPVSAGEREKTIIQRVLRRILALRDQEAPRWSWNRVHDLYTERKGIRVRDDEVRDLERAKASRVGHKLEQAAANEFQQLTARLERLEAALFKQDEEFYSVFAATAREALRAHRGMFGMDRPAPRPLVESKELEGVK